MNGWLKLASLGATAIGTRYVRRTMRNPGIKRGLVTRDLAGASKSQLRAAAIGHRAAAASKQITGVAEHAIMTRLIVPSMLHGTDQARQVFGMGLALSANTRKELRAAAVHAHRAHARTLGAELQKRGTNGWATRFKKYGKSGRKAT
jgi:hypothetical protein